MKSIMRFQLSSIIKIFKVISLNIFATIILTISSVSVSLAQHLDSSSTNILRPTESLNHQRVYAASGMVGLTYAGFAVGLNNAWYANFPRSKFHFFNDYGEWGHMDKFSHTYNTYFQCNLGYQGAKWAGLNKSSSILVGLGMGMLFQTTIEVLDGFSSNWGFSKWDMAFNLLGAGTFLVQQQYWNEQKVMIKLSAFPFKYPDFPIQSGQRTTNLQKRASDLYGTSLPSRILKDYNAINIWASLNIASIIGPVKGIPPWLNLALGVGANNLYGGFENSWEEDGIRFEVPNDLYPRYNQYFLALDIDWTRIKTDNPYLKTFFRIINIFKIPSPTFELTSQGNTKWHWFYL